MEDVKTEQVTPQAEPETAEQPSVVEQTAETPTESPDVSVQERTVPIAALQEERKRRQELQRQLAEKTSAEQFNQYDPEDINAILQHPMVQELMIKDARRELTDFARDTLDQYPGINEQLKKAILKNTRGFVNESTTDIETAKIDILEYIEEIAAEVNQEQNQNPTNKGFKVASTNVAPSQPTGAKPADIQAVLNKPVDEWTDEEAAAVDAYSKSRK